MTYKIHRDGSLEGDGKTDQEASLRSEEVSHIMSFKPGLFIRYGTFFFLLILLLFFFICAFIRYPDTINSSATIKANNAPSPLVLKEDVRLIKLRYTDKQYINRGDTIAVMQNQIESANTFLVAPSEGFLSLQLPGSQLQTVKASQVFGYIIDKNFEVYAEMNVSQANLGKIKEGTEVLFSLIAYPPSEYGSLKGKIVAISPVPENNEYVATVVLPEGLTTDKGKSLKYYEGLQAVGRVTVSDQTLLEQFFKNTFGQSF